jgi:hypothetical protein
MTRSWLRAATAVAAIAIVAPTTSAQNAVNVTFNGPNGANDLNLFFVNLDRNVIPTSGAGSVFNWDAAAGVSDNGGAPGGGLLTNATDATAVYTGAGGTANPVKWNLNSGARVSTMFMATALPTDRFIQIGFMNEASNSLNNNAAQTGSTAYVSVRVYPTSQLEFQTKNTTAGTNNVNFQPAGASLTLNNWYRISLNVQETSPTNFSATAVFDDFGPAGTALVSNLFTGTLTATVSGFELGNGNLLGGDGLAVAAMRQVASPANFDNFTVVVAVPEPTWMLALAAGAGVLWKFRRRRSENATHDSVSDASRV